MERELGPESSCTLSAMIGTPDPIALSKAAPSGALSVRLIAFYLPQFHPTPENDEWWGPGFTEWSNVVRAKPQFAGHYQPHLPGELGFYDLRLVEIQKRQVELAKLYGIGGFCFYFYWFAGKRLLERPIKQFLVNKDLEFPFCLCWANENWSRRWDGRDDHLLISQRHSPSDDIAFITYLSKYIKDRRYIRINGRPLLIVYRPDILPSAAETAKRWRLWCSANGIGEIFLAYTQSFKSADPGEYGFDAAIEFPPNNSNAPDITHQVEPLNPKFRGVAYDWRVFPLRSRSYTAPKYQTFRAVCPSWDNEARRKGLGTVYVNSSPEGYEDWLLNACNETLTRARGSDEQLVFVNAWNEWAEGAHLEPDARYGYAYLAATRRAIQAAEQRHQRQAAFAARTPNKDSRSEPDCPTGSGGNRVPDLSRGPRNEGGSAGGNSESKPALTVVLHAFYPEVLAEMLELLYQWEVTYRLCVTVPQKKRSIVSRIINAAALSNCEKPQVLECANRGRDVLPLIKVIDRLVPAPNELILKLHTKKTVHRKDGDSWRKDLSQKLLDRDNLPRVLQAFESDPNLGIVAAAGHIVNLEHHWGDNKQNINALCDRMDLMYPRARGEYFPGGSMFFSRFWAIAPIAALKLSDNDFPPEAGQTDGTTAHAIERLFGCVCHAQGGTLSDTGNLSGESSGGHSPSYPYANSDKVTRKLRQIAATSQPN